MHKQIKVPFNIKYPIIAFPYTLVKSILLGVLNLTLCAVQTPFGILGGNFLPAIASLLISVINIPLWFVCPIMQTISASKFSEEIERTPGLAPLIEKSPLVTANLILEKLLRGTYQNIFSMESSEALDLTTVLTKLPPLMAACGLRGYLSVEPLTNPMIARRLDMTYDNSTTVFTSKPGTPEIGKVALMTMNQQAQEAQGLRR